MGSSPSPRRAADSIAECPLARPLTAGPASQDECQGQRQAAARNEGYPQVRQPLAKGSAVRSSLFWGMAMGSNSQWRRGMDLNSPDGAKTIHPRRGGKTREGNPKVDCSRKGGVVPCRGRTIRSVPRRIHRPGKNALPEAYKGVREAWHGQQRRSWDAALPPVNERATRVVCLPDCAPGRPRTDVAGSRDGRRGVARGSA
jgi:hypothetical protein